MINWLLKRLFSFDRPVIRCKRPGCNRLLKTEQSRLLGYSNACWNRVRAEERERLMQESTANIQEIDKELQPK